MPDLDDLKAQRRDASAKVEGLRAGISKLSSLQSAVDQAQANLRDHDADVSDAMREWADAGGEGDVPVGDALARTGLQRQLGRAQHALSQAGEASAVLTGQLQTAAADLAAINAKIDAAALDQVQREHRGAVEDLRRFLTDNVKPRIAHVFGLRGALTEMAQQHQGSGRGDQAMALFQRGEAISAATPTIEFEPTVSDVIAAGSVWRARFHELTADAPASNVVRSLSADAVALRRTGNVYVTDGTAA